MAWIRRNLRGNKVYARVDEEGRLAVGADGRVDIVYKLAADAKVYRAAARNLEPTGDPRDRDAIERDEDESRAGPTSTRALQKQHTAGDAIAVWTDGACTGNPGPAGIGVVIVDGDDRRELSEYLGHGTNNIAELTAIERGLQSVPVHKRDRRVIVYSDSTYSIGLLAKGWRAKANQDLVARLRALTATFLRLEFVKVRGHAGVPENERCDELARAAIERSDSA